MDIDKLRQEQHDKLAWHIYNWRINDEIYQHYGNAEFDSGLAWAVIEHLENPQDTDEWWEKEEDYGGWTKYLSEEYLSYIREKIGKKA